MSGETSVCIIGLGYVGLPTVLALIDGKRRIIGVDINTTKIELLNSGEYPFDDDLSQLEVSKAVEEGKLSFSTITPKADIYLICVPTPLKQASLSDESIPQPDLSHVISAVESIIKNAPDNALIILESTCPVGTTRKIAQAFSNAGRNLEKLSIAYCPERVLPGNIKVELVNNDRLVGGLNERSSQLASNFYMTFVKGNIWCCDAEVAELCKIAENCYRDINIAFSNELSIICHDLEIDVNEVTRLANKHPRVKILDAGIGVGGHCVAVDPYFIAHKFPQNSSLIQTARKINQGKTEWVIRKINEKLAELSGTLQRNLKVGLFGLSYKANVGDIRESPALNITQNLMKTDHEIYIVDPLVEQSDLQSDVAKLMTHFNFAYSICDLNVFLVAHDKFKSININKSQSEHYLDFCGLFENTKNEVD